MDDFRPTHACLANTTASDRCEIRVAGTSPVLDWSYATDFVGNITSITDLLNATNNRTNAYQDVHYFLTQGNGPWGTRSWTYDKIGNRLTETRGTITDTYTYPTNGSGGRNPKLQSVAPPTGESRKYGYDAAGNNTFIYDRDNRLDLIYDSANRLSVLRSVAEDSRTHLYYDGRGYLRQASAGVDECRPGATVPTYDSQGLLRRREHDSLLNPAAPPTETDTILYFAGRPLATLHLTPTSSTLTYLTTDHLGTPILATADTGTLLWQGGFEPFGENWNGATAAGVFLRFPGQWVDPVWESSRLESGLYYNVWRWYVPSTGAYISSDPLRTESKPRVGSYTYSRQSPISATDPHGLFVVDSSCDCERQIPESVHQGLGKARKWARSPRCLAALDSRPDAKNCFKRQFAPDQLGNPPVIRCHSSAPPEGNYCGSATPSLLNAPAAIHIYPGNDMCPRHDPEIGVGATIVHETLHLCGIISEREAAELTKICTGFDARP